MSDPIQNVWSYQTGGFISSIVITSDGNSIIAGSDDKRVYCFKRDGNLGWWHEVEGTVFSLTLAEGSQRILAGCTSGTAYLWDYNGKLLCSYKTDGSTIWGAAMTPDARMVVLGTLDGSVFFFEGETRLWTSKLKGAARRLSMTQDGTCIAVGSEDSSIYVFNRRGSQLWNYKTDGPVWSGAQIVAGRYVAAGSNDHHLYLLDLYGNLLWKRDTGSFVHVFAAPPDGRCIAAAGASGTVYLFSTGGDVLWSYKTGGEVYALAVSADSRFIVAGSNDHHVYLLDAKGNCIWKQNTQREIFCLDLTPDGQFLAVGSRNHTLYLFKNIAAYSSDFIPWLTRASIRRVRSAYTNNPHLGMANWLDEFDYALRQKDFVSCQRLLKEIRQEGYEFSTREQTYIDTREAALLLCQGIYHHCLHEYDEARQYYEASSRLHVALGKPDPVGAGQVMLALNELGDQPVEPDIALLEQLMIDANVLGNSAILLTHRLETLPLAEQIQVLHAAKQGGKYASLQRGQQLEEEVVQATSALAMRDLRPGPDLEMLLDTMLPSPNWLVRWQAIDILQRRANEDASSFAQQQDQVRRALARQLEAHESDPTVRLKVAQLLLKIKDPADTPVLLRLLTDSDPDVRYEAVKVLQVLGDRRAIFPLQQVVDGRDFAGNSIGSAAKSSIQIIQQRLPASTVSNVALCRDLTDEGQPVQSMLLFRPQDPPRYCVVTITKPSSGVRVTCSISRQKTIVFQQELVFTASKQEEEDDDLIELIDPPVDEDRHVRRHSSPAEDNTTQEVLKWIIKTLTDFMEPPSGTSRAEARQRLRQAVLEQISGENEAHFIRNSNAMVERMGGSPALMDGDYFQEFVSGLHELLEDDASDEFLMGLQDLTELALELLNAYDEEALALARILTLVAQSLERESGENVGNWSNDFVRLLTEHEATFEQVGKAFSAYFEIFMEDRTSTQIGVARTALRTALYDLLDSAGEDFVAITYGKDEQETEEKDQGKTGYLLFSLPSTQKSWLPGEYLVEIALKDQIEVQRAFKIAEQVTIKRAVTCLAYNSAGEPADETADFTTGETIYCSVSLEHAPIGLEVQAQLRSKTQALTETPQKTGISSILKQISTGRLSAGSALSPNSQVVRTKTEGRQVVTFAWETGTRPPGIYTIEITMAEIQTDCVLQVLPNETSSLSAQDAKKFWLEQAESSFFTNHYGKALAAYEQAIRLDARSVPAWIGKGRTLGCLNRYEEALVAYDSAQRLDAGSALIHTRRGGVLFNLGHYKEALIAAEQAIRFDPSFLGAYTLKGLTLVNLNEEYRAVMQESLALFERNGQFDVQAYNSLGIAFDYLDRLEEALAAYKQASSLDPLDSYIYSNQGGIYKQLGHYEEALAVYEQSIHLDPHFPSSYEHKGDILVYYNRLEEALEAYEQASRLEPFNANTLTSKSTALMLLGRFDEAQQAFNAAQALSDRK